MKDRAGARTFVGWFFCVDRIGKYIFKIRNNHIPQDTRVHVSLICIFDMYLLWVCKGIVCMYVCMYMHTDRYADRYTEIHGRTDAQVQTQTYTKPATGREEGREGVDE